MTRLLDTRTDREKRHQARWFWCREFSGHWLGRPARWAADQAAIIWDVWGPVNSNPYGEERQANWAKVLWYAVRHPPLLLCLLRIHSYDPAMPPPVDAYCKRCNSNGVRWLLTKEN